MLIHVRTTFKKPRSYTQCITRVSGNHAAISFLQNGKLTHSGVFQPSECPQAFRAMPHNYPDITGSCGTARNSARTAPSSCDAIYRGQRLTQISSVHRCTLSPKEPV